MYTPGPKPPFDIRDIIPGSELDNDHLQARYDTANRMVLLTGSIPLRRFFTDSWENLLPEIADKVALATDLKLLRPRPELVESGVAACLEHLQHQHKDLSWVKHVATNYKRTDAERDQGLDRLYDAHIALWRQGIYFPHPFGCSCRRDKQCKAIDTLITTAGSRTYQGYFERLLPGASSDWSKEEIIAVRGAMKVGVVFNVANDRCCNMDLGVCENYAPDMLCLDCGDGDDPCPEPDPLPGDNH